MLRRAGEASATRGDLNILCLCIKLRDPGCGVGSTHFPPYTVRTDNTAKVRFSATVGQEPIVEVALV